MIEQNGDVKMFLTEDGFDIEVENGFTTMSPLFDNMVLLCLLGGNMYDTVTPDTDNLQYMGNEDEPENRQYRSRFLQELYGKPLNSSAPRRMREAAAFDITNGFGDLIESVECDVQLLTNIRVQVTCNIVLSSGAALTVATEIGKAIARDGGSTGGGGGEVIIGFGSSYGIGYI